MEVLGDGNARAANRPPRRWERVAAAVVVLLSGWWFAESIVVDWMGLEDPKEWIALSVALGVWILPLMILFKVPDSTPDHALFVYDRQERMIVPRPVAGLAWTAPVPRGDPSNEAEWDGVVSWGELQVQPEFEGYGLPEDSAWKEFSLDGRPVPLLQRIFWPPPSRWDEEGRWLY